MYQIKPIFDRSSIQIDLPTCMYKMKNTSEFNARDSQSPSNEHLTNGFNGAVSQLSTKSLPDVKQQIEKFLKVFVYSIKFKTNDQFSFLLFGLLFSQEIVSIKKRVSIHFFLTSVKLSKSLEKNVKKSVMNLRKYY